MLQEKYGYTRQQAAAEVEKRVAAYEAKLKKTVKPAWKSDS
jgi:hypothetical protein